MAAEQSVPTPDKLPPNDLDAEQVCLGACMIDPTGLLAVTNILEPKDFYREAHQAIYSCILEVERRGEPVDIVTVSSELRKLNRLDAVGGGEYLTALIYEVPTSKHAPQYASRVLETSVARQTILAAGNMQANAYDGAQNPISVIGRTLGELEQLQERCDGADSPQLTRDRSDEWNKIEQRRMRPYEVSLQRFGIPDLDRRTGGLEDAGFCVVKGGTNKGKSSLLRQIVLETAMQGLLDGDPGVTIVFAMEESGPRWRLRSTAWLGNFDSRAFNNALAFERYSQRNPQFHQVYADAAMLFDQLPLMVASGNQSIADIEAACRRISRKRPIRLVAIDYLQRIVKDEAAFGTEEQAWRDVSRRLTRLRDKLACPIIGPSQITVGQDGQSHTFGARVFEFDADLVMEIHREKSEDGTWMPECHIECQKSREVDAWGKFHARTDFPTGRWYAVDERRE